MNSNYIKNYFFILFSIIPISIVLGSTASLINILLIDLSFLFLIFYFKNWNYFLKDEVKILVIIGLYLIFNNLIAIDKSVGFWRNFGFIRFIIFFIATNYFFNRYQNFSKILLVWFGIVLLIVFDVYLESITGKNILGYGNKSRIFSVFIDEPIVGGFINSFYLMLIGYLFYLQKNNFLKNNFLILALTIFFLVSIIITGERSNGIKALTGFLIFVVFLPNFTIKYKFSCLLIFIFLISALFTKYEFLKLRYKYQLFNSFTSKEKIISFTENNIYIRLQKSGLKIFKDNIFFGIGNKNYRVVSCQPEVANKDYICNTHPHQTYIELLSEHGLVGTIILLGLIFTLMAKILKKIIVSRNQIQLGSFIYISIIFVPILPSGAFFGDYMSTLFWLNFSIMFSISKDTNIFR